MAGPDGGPRRRRRQADTPASPDELRARCSRCAGAVEEFPFGPGVAVWKVGGKVFSLVPIEGDPASISLKCDPEEALALREQYAAITPGYHLNKRHWNTVVVDGEVPDTEISEMIADSYSLVVASLPKRVRAGLSD